MPAQGEPVNKPSRLGGLRIKAEQKVPEPRNNGNATETKARMKMGMGVSRNVEHPSTKRALESDGLGIESQLHHVLAE